MTGESLISKSVSAALPFNGLFLSVSCEARVWWRPSYEQLRELLNRATAVFFHESLDDTPDDPHENVALKKIKKMMEKMMKMKILSAIFLSACTLASIGVPLLARHLAHNPSPAHSLQAWWLGA